MTVSATPRRAGPYAGNGVTTLFPFNFKVFTADDLQVVYTDTDGVPTTLVLNSDYSVLLNPDQDANPGGTITYPLFIGPTPELPVGTTLTAIGDLPYSQPTDITNTGRFLPQVFENALDRLTIQVQQLAEVSSRTLQAAVGTTVSLIFPAPSSGKFIRWRSDLLGLENADAGTDSMVLQGLLADSTVGTNGAGMVGFDAALTYPGGTAGERLAGLASTTDATKGTNYVGYRSSAANTAGRLLPLKLGEWTTITDFSTADKTGVADSRSAFLNADAFGQVIVPPGVFRVASNLSLTNRVWFMPGARVTIDGGATVTFNGGVQASDDQFVFAGVGNVAGLKRVTLNWFGAVGDMVADDTAAITRSIASGATLIESVDGCDYRFVSTIDIDRSNITFEFKTSEFLLDTATATASHFNVGLGVTQRSGIVFDGGVYLRQNLASAGAVFNMNFVGVVTLKNLRIYGADKVYRGVVASRAIMLSIFDCHIQDTVSNGVYAVGTGTGANRTVDLKIGRTRIEGTGGDAITTLDYVEGVYIEDCIIFDIAGACYSSNASSDAAGLVSFKLANTDFDTATAGIYINFVDAVSIDTPWISNVAGDGIRIDQCDSVNISGGQIYVTGANKSIRVGGGVAAYCRNITIGGGVILIGGEDGIYLTAVCANVNIGQALISGMTGYAVNKFLNPDQVTIVGASGNSNVTGDISAGGTNLVVANNNFI